MSIDDKEYKQKEYDQGPKASSGYGGKYGVQKDRMDKVKDRLRQSNLTFHTCSHVLMFS